MSDFIVTCCSTADMPLEFFKVRKIPFACFRFYIDGKEYLDDLGQSMPFEKFYNKIKEGAIATTSQVNVDQYTQLFEPILREGKDILHISFSSGLSGTYNSACIARDTLLEKYPGRQLYVVDSLGASSGYGLLVTTACDMRDEGKDIDKVCEWLEENKLRLHHWFFSTDLTSYYRGGRISRTSAAFGTLLQICPMLNMNFEGKLAPRDKYHGKRRVIKEIVKRMEEHAENGLDYSGKCYISHSACYEDAQTVADMIEERFLSLDGKVMINSVGTVIGSHTGPGTVALFFFGDKRED
jgi:DegV family protein with EDD domain